MLLIEFMFVAVVVVPSPMSIRMMPNSLVRLILFLVIEHFLLPFPLMEEVLRDFSLHGHGQPGDACRLRVVDEVLIAGVSPPASSWQ